MKISKGEYNQFSPDAKLQLLEQFGTLVTTKQIREIKASIYKLYDFYVEVLYDTIQETIVRNEPIWNSAMLDFYIDSS
jgi:hypothetical protein